MNHQDPPPLSNDGPEPLPGEAATERPPVAAAPVAPGLPRLGERDQPAPGAGRQWLQFSLRAFLATLLGAGVVAAVAGLKYRQVVGEQRAARGLADLGGSFDTRADGHVVHLAFVGPNRRSDTLQVVKQLPELRSLVLIDAPVETAALKALRGHPQLRELRFIRAPIGDDCFAHLQTLPRLETLWIEHSGVTDDGLAAIAQMRGLRSLNLIGAELSDAGLSHLEGLTQLEVLLLNETPVSFEAVQQLQIKLPQTRIRH